MALLEVSNLEVHYGKINALKGVSFSVEQGDFVALIGANGAGKTTLLNTISGVVPSSAGSVHMNGEEITNLRSDQITRRGIAHVPEGRKIFSELSVEDNLRVGAFILSDKARIGELIESNFELFPRLAERRKQEGGTLSGGEQQMLAIARGLMCDPDVILLDEPSLGIAPVLVERIFDHIVEINKRGRTVVLVEQNANLALHVVRYAHVLETGNLVRSDKSDVLMHDDAIRRAYLGVA